MKNTTKLKHILQLYTVQLDMDDERFFVFTLGTNETEKAKRLLICLIRW